jgi:hypothetical protein
MTEKVEETPQVDTKPSKPTVTTKPVKMAATSQEPAKTISKLVDEVMKGAHGSGRERMIVLGEHYEAVQHEVNKRIRKGDVL